MSNKQAMLVFGEHTVIIPHARQFLQRCVQTRRLLESVRLYFEELQNIIITSLTMRRGDDNVLGDQTPFRVLGLDIQFPFNPYGIQKAMMNKVVATLINKEHSLIESPTGTGKTLVLLCSALAWRTKSVEINRPFVSPKFRKKLLEERIESLKKKPCHCGRRMDSYQSEIPEKDKSEKQSKKGCYEEDSAVDVDYFDSVNSAQNNGHKKMKMSNSDTNHEIITLDDSDCENSAPKKASKVSGDIPRLDLHRVKAEENSNSNPDGKLNKKINTNKEDRPPCKSCKALNAEDFYLEMMSEENSVDESFFDRAHHTTRIPKIYYGTRTHKQITQVVRELNKTIYCKNFKTCILSSRDRTCVNEEVRDMPNRNDKCKELINNHKAKNVAYETCSYYSQLKLNEKVFLDMHEEYRHKAWDIEDAADFGKRIGCCPYFGIRELMMESSVIFCPYNYLLDPSIRKVMDINLKNSVIIFDEAHNIEDICRDSASFTINSKQIEEMSVRITKTLTNLLPGKTYDALRFYQDFFLALANWMMTLNYDERSNSGNESKFEKTPKYFKNKDDVLNVIDMTEEDLTNYLTPMKNDLLGSEEDEASSEKDKKQKNDTEEPTILEGHQAQLIIQLIITLNFMFASKRKFFNDFELVVTKQLEPKTNKNFATQVRNNKADAYVWEFNLLCMNSAVSFEKVKNDAWSVIVASGTLSPIESLRTELGVSFEYTFEGAHMIGKDRFFASIISRGPKNIDLNCNWKNTNTLQVQDELGYIVRDVCKAVPNGVLCFFPSYDRMDAFYKRWNFMNLLHEIRRSGKTIHRETKDLSADSFEYELTRYRENARSSGAILMAVFRGKVSEGIDFSDQDARAVITIGIPYPHLKDVAVNLKKDYNDRKNNSERSNLLNGREWYSAQAFRALNQALGRCIRHKDDWGAIIMLDSRLLQFNAKENISKWIRQNTMISKNYDETYDALTNFVRQRES